jgi:hypothetical protein
MSKPRLLLHIGHPKTGTTSIQTFLLANRTALRRHGVLYPETGIHDSAHRLLSPAFFSAAGLENRAPAHMASLLAEIQAAACPVIVLSFEGFCGDNPASFTALRDRFDVTVIYYVRRQDLIAESRYAQHVRSFLMQEVRPASEAVHRKGFAPDYLRVLRLYEAVFGRGRLIVRAFERNALVNRDLIDDFLSAAEIPRAPEYVPSTSSNASLKRPYLAFKRHCNLLPYLDDEQKRLNKNLNDLSQADPAPSLGHLLSPVERRNLFESQQADNAETARTYLGRADGVLFHDPPPPPDDPWEPLRPLDPDAQRAIVEKLSPENRDCLEFLHRPARLALPGDPLLPDLPDGNPAELARLLEKRHVRQCQRRLAVLEQLASRLAGGPGRS